MRTSLRIAAEFQTTEADKLSPNSVTLKRAVIIDDAAAILHEVNIECGYVGADDEPKELVQRLTYTIQSLHQPKVARTFYNDFAEQLLSRLAMSLNGLSVGHGLVFTPSMFGPVTHWSDEMPGDKPRAKKKAATS